MPANSRWDLIRRLRVKVTGTPTGLRRVLLFAWAVVSWVRFPLGTADARLRCLCLCSAEAAGISALYIRHLFGITRKTWWLPYVPLSLMHTPLYFAHVV